MGEIRALLSFWDPLLSEPSYLPGKQRFLNSDKNVLSYEFPRDRVDLVNEEQKDP